MTRPFIQYLEKLIGTGETVTVLNILSDFLPEEQETLKDECILHKSALKKNDKDVQLGIITEDVHNQVVSRVNYALLNIFTDIESLEFDDAIAIKKAKTIEQTWYKTDNTLGNVKEIKKRKLWKYAAITGVLVLTILLGWTLKNDKFSKKKIPILPISTKADSLVAAEAFLHEAENRRAVNEYDDCIKDCQEALKWNNRNSFIYNQLAECYLYKGEITAAFENAKKAYQCDSIDSKGMIMSTLAQVYGEMGNTKLFYVYTEESLKRGFDIWEYETELGFNKYKDEQQFKMLIKKYKER